MSIYLNPEAFKDKAIPPIKNKEHIINTTYAELKGWLDNSQLIPGMQYRITDYITTTTQENTQSANHPFDIIVIADKANKLNCKARAVQHEGDTYFNTSQLEKWELWYDIENNTDKYVWADTVNGKGVIYRMIDEWNNDCPYDFKNIKYIGDWQYYAYTFNWINDESDNSCEDLSVAQYVHTNDENNYSHTCNNIIKPCQNNNSSEHGFPLKLNVCIFINRESYESGIYYGCYNNSFGNNCYNNSLGNNCNNNSFGNNCQNNSFGNDYNDNSLENNCHNNLFGDNCYGNSFGNNCYGNSLGNNCYGNSLGNNCYNNLFGDNCDYNVFVNNCYGNSLGNNCHNNSFGNDCEGNLFGNNCQNNSLGNSCDNIKFALDKNVTTKYNYYKNNHFGDGCSYILFKGITTASDSQQIQNYNFAQGLEGIWNAFFTIDGVRNRSYETKVAKDSNGELKQYCEADLIS